MVRFSCFLARIHCHKSKKVVQQPSKPMHKIFHDSPEDQALKVSSNPLNLDPYLLKAHDDNPSNSSVEKVTSSSSVENCWKPEEMNSNFSSEGYVEVHQTVSLKKSQSLGSGLVKEGFVSSGVDTEDEVYHGFSCENSLEKNYIRMFDVLDHGGLVEPIEGKGSEMELLNQYPEVMLFESFRENSDMGDPETMFSNGEPMLLKGEGHEDYAIQSSGEHANCSEHGSPVTSPLIAKSCSLPNIGACIPVSREASPSHAYMGPRHISFEDLDALDVGKKEFLNHNFESHAIADEETENKIFESYKDNCEESSPDGHDSSNIRESSAHRWDELPSKDFKIKRIEDWVSSIDIQDSNPTQEINESSYSTKVKKIPNAIGGVTIAKLDAKTTPGIEAAQSYISSLSSTSTAAQLANLGLVAIPFLSAFGNLRGLNLSGNAIVRITAGALPRGLHMLNLSKNNISTIEGLRELTRLRVLDMSHNRIFRIGHGLSSCSSLKELYLVGNKISEVEGLHRLLKLNVLDLRFNKISTAKCLGQLAANYISLQDISLEGNPAQKNVGDEQLKKYLQGLLPHLVSFNKQPMKANSSKEAITVHQSDRGLRSEQKLTRRGSHGLATPKVSSKRSKSRYVNIPTSGIKESSSNNNNHRHHPLDLRRKLLGWSDLSMRRSQSEGTLGTSS